MPKEQRDDVKPVIEGLRMMIRRSDHSQRQVEEAAGFSRGYLSQLLAENLDLKMWHVLAVLRVFEVQPAAFFDSVYPRQRTPSRGESLEQFAETSEPLAGDIEDAVAQLYQRGVDSLRELRHRLNRCELAVDQLEARGYVQLAGIDFGRDRHGGG